MYINEKEMNIWRLSTSNITAMKLNQNEIRDGNIEIETQKIIG